VYGNAENVTWHDIKVLSCTAVTNNSKSCSLDKVCGQSSPTDVSRNVLLRNTQFNYTLHATVKWRNSSRWQNMHHSKWCDHVQVSGLTDQSVSVGWCSYTCMEALQILVMVLQMYLTSARNVALGCLYSCNAVQQYRSVMCGITTTMHLVTSQTIHLNCNFNWIKLTMLDSNDLRMCWLHLALTMFQWHCRKNSTQSKS